MSDFFKDTKIFIISLKLSEYDIGYYRRLIEKYGGSTCRSQTEATLILTILKSPTRINRNITNHKIPVVDVLWIKECASSKMLLPMKDFIIVEPTFAQPKFPPKNEILNRKFSNLPPEDLQFDDDNMMYATITLKPKKKHFFKEKINRIDLDDSESDDGDEVDIDIASDFVNSKYECLRPTPYEPKYNRKLVSLLLILERKRQLDGENKRSLSYRHAISAIKAYPRKIRSSKEAAKIIGIGKKISEKVKVFLKTGTIEEAELLRSDEKFRTMSLFNQVFGVGIVTAKIWWNLGYRSLQEVLDKAKITSAVRLGIKLYPDFSQLMSREDVEEILLIIKEEAHSIDSNITITPVGGYRRRKTKNGDLDVIISNQKGPVHGLLAKLMNKLVDRGCLKHKLWTSSEVGERKQKSTTARPSSSRQTFDSFEKCFCAFLQPSTGIHRQVDLISVPSTELPLAILGWTGSRQFERSIRDYAKKEKSMTVNSQSIHITPKNGSSKRITVNSEEEAFRIIGVPYLEPELRNC